MAKSLEKIEATKLRSQGESIKVIAKKLGISKSSASTWTKDIILTVDQLEKLYQRQLKGSELGRTKGALIQKQRRIEKYNQAYQKITTQIGSLSPREKLLIGAALYWAEGTKKGRRVDVCNSDPNLVKFMLNWFKEQFSIPNSGFRIQLGINEDHKSREEVVKKYWSDLLNIPLSQFTKSSFKHAKLKKIYANFNEYYGTPKIYVKNPATIHAEVIGLVKYLQDTAM